MMDTGTLAFATIEELSALLTRRKLSVVELTELFLKRIEVHNPQLNAYLPVTIEHALNTAREADKKLARSRKSRPEKNPLLGIPIAIKDNFLTKNIRTTAGSRILRDSIPG